MTKSIHYFILLSITMIFPNQKIPTIDSCTSKADIPTNYRTIVEIAAPAGYQRRAVKEGSFGEWLRTVKLKQDSIVYLYDGRLRDDQATQFAVLNMPVGDKDLQQCADAIMRLRAEYFFESKLIDSIYFKSTAGTVLSFAKWLRGERYKLVGNRLRPYLCGKSANSSRAQLEQFLEVVFSYCGTISLNNDTRPVQDLNDITGGDILVKPGSPGHAMIVVDVASNDKGQKIFLLAQGFMPAQSIHIVKNLSGEKINPWYSFKTGPRIITPQWVFYKNQLKRW